MKTKSKLELKYDSLTDWSKLQIMSQQKHLTGCLLPGAFERDVKQKMEQGLGVVCDLSL